jgi:hypothetical protein
MIRVIAIAFLLTSALCARAADPCARANTTLTPAQRKMYARSIASNLTSWHPPAQIEIDKAMSLGNWTAVWAKPGDTRQGVFFYSEDKSGLKYHDVWNGSVTPPDRSQLVQWVEKLDASVPEEFARCFAQTVTGEH